jgi:hypothetical protein
MEFAARDVDGFHVLLGKPDALWVKVAVAPWTQQCVSAV